MFALILLLVAMFSKQPLCMKLSHFKVFVLFAVEVNN